jgi:uncharacterized GH25 family protein
LIPSLTVPLLSTLSRSLALTLTISLLLFLADPTSAGAHDFWLSEDQAAIGKPLTLTLGYGHNFPTGEDIPRENLDTRFQQITLIGPGSPYSLLPGQDSKLLVTDKPLQEGLFIAYGQTTPLFLTQTTEGWSIKAKDEVDQPLKSNLSTKYAKAVLNVGQASNENQSESLLTRPVGHKLEIIPLTNPSKIRPGGQLPVKLLFKGTIPLADTELSLLAVGEETTKVTAKTDSQGQALIPIPARPGLFRLMAEHSIPYEGDLTKADSELNIVTLTFRISE